ncbi:3-dehydroshikimate dehydratase [Penicillium diatomitis]|uniref:3-dehydroshikimate dehydratase n=1 Tax=Penicillium diatomitis TaxID=2819901 RepID=A0A9X0BXX8_9EURO|nr:3-dehydroshikimate dehydratase [Penicillium diatomitis]KAJ5489220.1 3-dehydroshikimate dehydratase [Penicillium diatomitis]
MILNRPGIASMSLGKPWVHNLPDKLLQAAAHGFQGIELFFDDLDCYAHRAFNGDHLEAAHQTRTLCNNLGLTIICLQPFSMYEGLLDRAESDRLINDKLPRWFRLARALGTDMIQVPCNFLGPDPQTGAARTTGDRTVIVRDLQRLADLGAGAGFRFVYEALCWGDHVDTWEASWEIVRAVDRSNFGLCLDSFNIAGRVYADPSSASGKTPHAAADMAASLQRLRAAQIDPSKIFYVQLVDGERLASPLDANHPFHVAGQPARMSWSRNARLFPFEESRGGYLPILDIASVFFDDIGFRGWVSLELFSRTLADPSPTTPADHARRGIESYIKMGRLLQWQDHAVTDKIVDLSCQSVGTEAPLQHRL